MDTVTENQPLTNQQVEDLLPAHQAYMQLQSKLEALRHYAELLGSEDLNYPTLIALADSMLGDLPILFKYVYQSEAAASA